MTDKDKTEIVETLMDCIERLFAVLRESNMKEKAEAIYHEFFGQ